MPSRKKKPSLSRMFTTGEIADLMDFKGHWGNQRARRWLRRLGIAHTTPTGRVYTTMQDLQGLDDDGIVAEILEREQ